MEYKVVKVSFFGSNRIHFFNVNDIPVKKGDFAILDTEKGVQIAKIISNIMFISDEKIGSSLKNIIRIATDEDKTKNEKNILDSKKALNKAKEISDNLELEMNILNAYFTFDRSQLIFNFISDERVDFRELAKKLASIYKTRIELRQIGVRDKAKDVGGIGPCGRFLCCNLFLNDFESVSINMAKNQYLSLKPDKINGICGRLLCCLNYEDEQYTELKKGYPKIGSQIELKGKTGKVISYDLFKRTFSLEKEDKSIIVIGIDEYESNK